MAIIRTEGACNALVAAASQTEWPILRTQAARAMGNLSFCYAARSPLADTSGAIASLIAILDGIADDPKMQAMRAHAGRALVSVVFPSFLLCVCRCNLDMDENMDGRIMIRDDYLGGQRNVSIPYFWCVHL